MAFSSGSMGLLLPDADNVAFENPEIVTIYRYWSDLKAARSGLLPGRAHVDPIDIAERSPAALPCVWLLDVVPPEPRFRLRLIGSALVDAGATIRVGTFVDEVEDSEGPDSLTGDLRGALTTRLPGYKVGPPALTHSRFASRVERLSLPLAADGEKVDMFLCASAYTRK